MKIGIFGVLGIVFVVLKLAEVTAIAQWSWWAVLLPFYGPLAAFLVIVGIGAIVAAIADAGSRKRRF